MIKINSAEILCVGTEILIGDIVNTNAAYISSRLAALGINQYYQAVVGDNPARLEQKIREALERTDLLIMTGGLGPTYDDLTKETAAKCMGRKLYLHERSLERMTAYFKSRNYVMSETNKKQAYMPESSVVFDNDHGTAPGLAMEDEVNGKIVIMLPGPPREMKPMWDDSVEPYLLGYSESMFYSKNINITGMGESAVEEVLADYMKSAVNPTVAPYCKEGEVRLRVTAKAGSEADARKMCDETIDKILESEVGKYDYGINVDSLEHALVNALHEHSLTLCTAESCTGGLIAERITAVAGCSDVFFGGCVTYTNEIKQRLLGVSADTLSEHGAVSAQTAMEMARGARERLGTDIAVSATGLAGPTGGTPETPVGTVFIGVSTKNGEDFRKLTLSAMRSRDYIRTVSATNALDMALKAVSDLTNIKNR